MSWRTQNQGFINGYNQYAAGTTGAAVTSNNAGTTGQAVLNNLASYINSIGNAVSNVIFASGQKKALENGNYYSSYNQGQYNSYNSTGTIIFVMAGVVAIVLIAKK